MSADLVIHSMESQARTIHAIALEALLVIDVQQQKRLVTALHGIQDCADRVLNIGQFHRPSV